MPLSTLAGKVSMSAGIVYFQPGDPRFVEPNGQLTFVPAADLPPARQPEKARKLRRSRKKPVRRNTDVPDQATFTECSFKEPYSDE
jgi:hypothetical protein